MSKKETGDRIGQSLYIIYFLMLLASVFFFIRVIYIQYFWTPDSEIEKRLTPKIEKVDLVQKRGSILSDDGRPLAMSYPRYQLFIDCRPNEAEILKMSPEEQKAARAKWKADAAVFAEGLAEAFAPNGKDAEYYKKLLLKNFEAKNRYLKLGKPIEKEKLDVLKKYPLIKDGKFKGGVWHEEIQIRRYPYGSLARRTIGSVTENAEHSYYSGIEGKYNHILHGEPGYYYVKQTDEGRSLVYDSLYVNAVNGQDIHTTLNVDYQEIADKALRKYLGDNPEIAAGCFVLMDVKTGAIKAMVNLSKGKDGSLGENENIAVTWRGEPGSVFKITTLMTAIEDGYITDIDQTIPGNHGILPGYEKQPDKHIVDYEREHRTTDIPIRYCVQVSSNYAFRYLARTYYQDKPEEFINKLYQYQLGTAFEFDLAEKITNPDITNPSRESWTPKDLTQIAMGYSVSITPMHLLMYYNAIANKGKMMKPYLVEDSGPTVLNSSICKASTAEMITEGLSSVTDRSGTAWRLRQAPCSVAGKTGTSYIAENGKYITDDGTHRQQGTFVGFFPAEDPHYTLVCSIYTEHTKKDYFGGVIPVQVSLQVIKELFNIDPYFHESL